MALFGRSNKKYKQQTIQILGEAFSNIEIKQIENIYKSVSELKYDTEELIDNFQNDMYNAALELASNINTEMDDRIGYLKYKSDKNNASGNICAAYLYILNALTGKKASNEDTKDSINISVSFINEFNKMIYETRLAACNFIEPEELRNLMYYYFKGEMYLKENPSLSEMEDACYEGRISQNEYEKYVDEYNGIKDMVAKHKQVIDSFHDEE